MSRRPFLWWRKNQEKSDLVISGQNVVLREKKLQDAVDDSRFNAYRDNGGHDADSAEVFLGYPRNINLGFQFNFR